MSTLLGNIQTLTGRLTLVKGRTYSATGTCGEGKDKTIIGILESHDNAGTILGGISGMLYLVNPTTMVQVCQYCAAPVNDASQFNNHCSHCGKQP